MKKVALTLGALILGVILEKKYEVYNKAQENLGKGLDYLKKKAEEAKENIQENLEELNEDK